MELNQNYKNKYLKYKTKYLNLSGGFKCYKGTETAFKNPYYDNKESGIYVDLVDGTPLFSSIDKFDSGTGWPSFSKPISNEDIYMKFENNDKNARIEVLTKKTNCKLGHLFNDGPDNSLRYCLNSVNLHFIPLNLLEQNG